MNFLARLIGRLSIDPVRFLASLSEEARKGWILLLSTIPYCMEKPDEITAIFRERIAPFRIQHPWWTQPLFVAERHPRILFLMLRLGMRYFAKRFVAGNGREQILAAIYRMSRKGYAVNLDILGERVRSKKEEMHYQEAYLELIKDLGRELPYGFVSVSLKISSFCSQINAFAPERSAEKIVERLTPIMEELKHCGGHAYLDAEEYALRRIHLLVFKTLYQQYGSTVRFVLQAYLRCARETLDELAAFNNPRDPIWIRLVRGAYWYLECFVAELSGWKQPPVFTKKSETDCTYEDLLQEGFHRSMIMVPATHNVDTLWFAAMFAYATGRIIPEIQVLDGVGNAIAEELVKTGQRVCVYMPVGFPRGSIMEILPYLVRRIDESKVSMIMQASGAELECLRLRLQEISEFPSELPQERRMS